jgi:FkbM family methyltransferase
MAMAMDRYEVGTTRLLQQVIKPGMVVVDAGAHVGYYTLLAARHVAPAGKVYAFEPAPANFDLLLRNIQRNEYANVVAVNAALSKGAGQATLYLTGLDNGRHSLFRHGLPQQGSVVVQTTTLDAFLEAEGWPRVDLVKVDVEGAEADVLKGMEQLLRKPGELKLILEFNPLLLRSAGLDPLQFLNRPADWGFDVYWIDEKKGPMPLESVDRVPMVAKLLNGESSVNLYCARP